MPKTKKISKKTIIEFIPCTAANPEDKEDARTHKNSKKTSQKLTPEDISDPILQETETNSAGNLTITQKRLQSFNIKSTPENTAHSSNTQKSNDNSFTRVVCELNEKLAIRKNKATNINGSQGQPENSRETQKQPSIRATGSSNSEAETTSSAPSENAKSDKTFNVTLRKEKSIENAELSPASGITPELEKILAKRRKWEEGPEQLLLNDSKQLTDVHQTENARSSDAFESSIAEEEIRNSTYDLESLKDALDLREFELIEQNILLEENISEEQADKDALAFDLESLKDALALREFELLEQNILLEENTSEEQADKVEINSIHLRRQATQDSEQDYRRKLWGLSIINETSRETSMYSLGENPTPRNSEIIEQNKDLTPRNTVLSNPDTLPELPSCSQPLQQFGVFSSTPNLQSLEQLNTDTKPPSTPTATKNGP